MPKPKNKALEAQRLYLETKDPKYIEELYRNLVFLGLAIQDKDQSLNLSKDPDEVLDLASSICLKLMERQTEVIRTAPSSYMKQSLFYRNKSVFHDCVDDIEIESSDRVVDPYAYERAVNRVLADASVDLGTELGLLVKQTLDSRMSYVKVSQKIKDPELKLAYNDKMMEVKQSAEDYLQGNGVLPIG